MSSQIMMVIKALRDDLSHPLSIFRIAYGLLMTGALSRIWIHGWIESLYIQPSFHFKYQYWTWIPHPSNLSIYALFILGIISALGISLGGLRKKWLFKSSVWTFFISFTFIELIDKAYYLNHYYLISLLAFIMAVAPSHYFLQPKNQSWPLWMIRLQITTLYFFSGIAKIQYDWLCTAQPLKIWLENRAHYPMIGSLLSSDTIAFLFSWAGFIFDLIIGFLLIHPRLRGPCYFFVITFHLMTAWLFPNIGLFPYFMIFFTLVYFDGGIRLKERVCVDVLLRFFKANKIISILFVAWFTFHWIFPLRPYIYDGDLLWHEKGYRFGWRVMLMEKLGRIDYELRDSQGKILWRPKLSQFLNETQIKQLSFQSDMAVEFAHYLKEYFYQHHHQIEPMHQMEQYQVEQYQVGVYAKCYVTVNGRLSKLYWDPNLDLTQFPSQTNIVGK